MFSFLCKTSIKEDRKRFEKTTKRKMIDLKERERKGTPKNIKAYREYCLKNKCFCTLSFEQYMDQSLTKYLK